MALSGDELRLAKSSDVELGAWLDSLRDACIVNGVGIAEVDGVAVSRGNFDVLPNSPWLYLEAPDSLGVSTVDRMLEKDVIDPRGGNVGLVALPKSLRLSLRSGVDSDLPKKLELAVVAVVAVVDALSSGSDSRRYDTGDSHRDELPFRRFELRSSSAGTRLPSRTPNNGNEDELGTARNDRQMVNVRQGIR